MRHKYGTYAPNHVRSSGEALNILITVLGVSTKDESILLYTSLRVFFERDYYKVKPEKYTIKLGIKDFYSEDFSPSLKIIREKIQKQLKMSKV